MKLRGEIISITNEEGSADAVVPVIVEVLVSRRNTNFSIRMSYIEEDAEKIRATYARGDVVEVHGDEFTLKIGTTKDSLGRTVNDLTCHGTGISLLKKAPKDN